MISVEIMCNGFFKCLLGKLILQETEASSGKEIKIFVKGGNFVVFLCKILLPLLYIKYTGYTFRENNPDNSFH